MRVTAILQARLSSTRLPGKVIKPLAGAPMILRQIERMRRAERLDRVVVATSTEASDDPLAELLAASEVDVFRGPLDDVLARYLRALEAWPADHVVRLTADCPLADPQVIDATVALHLETGADYTNNRYDPHGWPKGLDVEVIAAEALRRAGREAGSSEEREHVTWGIRNRPDRYKLSRLQPPVDEGTVRWTVDTAEDYAFMAAVYDGLYPTNPAFSSDDVRALVRSRPYLAEYGGDRRV